MSSSDETVYRRSPDDALHGGVLVVGDAARPSRAVRRICDGFCDDGYEAVGCGSAGDVAGLLADLPAPRFLVGIGAGAVAALAEAEGAAAVSAFYPEAPPARRPAIPTILHYGRSGRLEAPPTRALMEDEPELPVYVYMAADGFFEADSPAYDADSANLARLRTLALFRRSVARGEV